MCVCVCVCVCVCGCVGVCVFVYLIPGVGAEVVVLCECVLSRGCVWTLDVEGLTVDCSAAVRSFQCLWEM